MELFSYIWNYIKLATIIDLLDIMIVSYFLYKLIKLIKNTTASRLLKGIVLLLVAMQISEWLQLNVVNYIFKNTLELGFLAVVILFQPELRKMLEQVGRSRLSIFSDRGADTDVLVHAIAETTEACSAMSGSKTGALIVFEREDKLTDLVSAETNIDSSVTAELLKNIFYPKAPLHDGAVIIRDGRVLAAGCVLPLSQNETLSRDLGTRHRAAVGMSENSDAVCIVVSEETGSISAAIGGTLKRHLAPETLEKLLRSELMPRSSDGSKKVFNKWLVKGK